MLTIAQRQASEQFQSELQAVNQQLEAAITELYPPLDYLARGQLAQVRPLVRAAVVLTAAVGAPDHATLREQRLRLAAALEMLHIALRIHRLLLNGSFADGEESNQRSVTGSVILTGDYCFTRSAILAAQTDNVAVVALFSQTLKQISEAILRQLFQSNGKAVPAADTPALDENLALFQAGINAAAILAPLPPQSIPAMHTFAAQVADALAQRGAASVAAPQLPALTDEQQSRWLALQQWLTSEVLPE